MIQKPSSLVILGAGAPHYGDYPTVLRKAHSNTSVLQWIINSSGCTLDNTTFIAGYQADLVRNQFPNLSVVDNSDWQSTGSGASLLLAELNTKNSLLVSYGDILFRRAVSVKLLDVKADIVVAWDSAWKNRYAGRTIEDLASCEKVVLSEQYINRLGSNIPVESASGEFIGLVQFSPRAIEWLMKLKKTTPVSLRNCHLSDYIEYLRVKGLSVGAVDIAGDWAEFNEPSDIAQFILGTKADTLDRLRTMIRQAKIQDQITFTVSQWRNKPSEIVKKLRDRFTGRSLAVRSSSRSEDTFSASNAGSYDSFLDIKTESELVTAVEKVITSYGKSASEDQVLIQPMVENVRTSGVVLTRTLEHGAPWYIINYENSNDTKAITGGTSKNHHTLYLRRSKLEIDLPDPSLKGLTLVLHEIEATLGYGFLDIEFAIDAENQIHILQVRPIVIGKQHNELDDEVYNDCFNEAHIYWKKLAKSPPHLPGDAPPLYGKMPDWNPAEIIGTAPGALAVSLYRYLVTDDIWAQQRAEYGYRNVRPSPLLYSFAGHPYVDVRASFASFIPASLSDELAGRLLNFYLYWLRTHPKLHDKVEFEVVPTCITPGFDRWENRLCNEGNFTQADVVKIREGLLAITNEAFQRYTIDRAKIDTLVKSYEVVMANTTLAPLEKAQILLDDCRRYGTLPFAHLARGSFIAINLLRDAEANGIISTKAVEGFLSSLKTVSHGLKVDSQAVATGCLDWTDFVKRYGHLRPGTYDVTSPRYDANLDFYLRPLVKYANQSSTKEECLAAWQAERDAFFISLSKLGLPSDKLVVENFLREVIEGREYSKFIFSRNLSAALETLTEFATSYGLDRKQLSNLSLEDLMTLKNTSQSRDVVKSRLLSRIDEQSMSQRIASVCKLPSLLTNETELDSFLIGKDEPNFIGSKMVTAKCIDLSKYSTKNSIEVTDRIVLIHQADPGYDWLFGHSITGLVTLYGGANSHMAIRAAEFGIPAAIGVGEQRYNELARAKVIELSPSNSLIRVVR